MMTLPRILDEIGVQFTVMWQLDDPSVFQESNSLVPKERILDFVSRMSTMLPMLTSWQYPFESREAEIAERIADLDKVWMDVQLRLAEEMTQDEGGVRVTAC